MDTHDIGNTFFYGIRLRWNAPPVHRWSTIEMEEPYRVAISKIVHLWPTTLGFGFGRWKPGPLGWDEELQQTRPRDDDDAIRDAINLKSRAPAAELQEGVRFAAPVKPREIEDIQAYMDGDKIVIDYAPRFGRINLVELAESGGDLPRWRGKDNVYKLGKYRYVRNGGIFDFGRYEAVERVDRRGPIKFLFGGAQPWD